MSGLARPSSLRLIAVLVFIGLPLVLAALTVQNILQLDDDRYAIAEKEMQVTLMNRRLNAPGAAGKTIDFTAIYVTGASRTLASANLQQQLVNSIAAAAGRLIETVSVDPVDPADMTEAVRLKATLDIDNDGLLHLLYALESGLPLLDIDALSIRSLSAGSDTETQTLRVDMTVSATWRQQATQ